MINDKGLNMNLVVSIRCRDDVTFSSFVTLDEFLTVNSHLSRDDVVSGLDSGVYYPGVDVDAPWFSPKVCSEMNGRGVDASDDTAVFLTRGA